ncbi:DUF2569 family protein [Escherichia coli]|uniref:DUF2569 family protein n=1 Tax=Escherichia coli TaxID=562 RepID=UPI0010EC78C1|nr:DUF2569 family protein [Escherichia coli]EEQ6106221.1 DUF2569 family protein [Escherichia coli]EES4275421.1 DUF2569 family protein [Escherichia coli]EET0448177.1 DUF2569 family protein [Escherichia coli]EEU2543984.1 DUF2569 family protein [Escherichia coli]EEV8826150.1 DUF2569 family protein [Escherichia coli]
MRDKSKVLTREQKNRFGLILYIILLSVVYILVTRLNLITIYYSLYTSLDGSSQVTEYFIISIATFLFLSGLCLLFIYSFFKRKRVLGKLLLGIHVLYISHYAITFVYCLYVVGAECMTTGKIENILIDIIIAMLSLSYVCLSGKARNIFVN